MYLKAILLLAAAGFCLPCTAYATGTATPPGTSSTTSTPSTPSTPSTSESTSGPGSSATAGDGSAASSSATSSSPSSVGATTSSSGGNSLGSGNNTTFDASDRSTYRSNTVFIPSVVPGTPPSYLGVGNIIRETSACGPLQHIVRAPVNGTFIGLFRNTTLPQGWSDDLEPFRDESGTRLDYRMVRAGNGDVHMFGHQVTMFTTVIGVASNRNIALGAGGEGGNWGQVGMGSSSSNQQMVTNIQLRECEIGTMHTVVREVAPKAIRR